MENLTDIMRATGARTNIKTKDSDFSPGGGQRLTNRAAFEEDDTDEILVARHREPRQAHLIRTLVGNTCPNQNELMLVVCHFGNVVSQKLTREVKRPQKMPTNGKQEGDSPFQGQSGTSALLVRGASLTHLPTGRHQQCTQLILG